jgi:hypothetical protein
MWLPSWGLKTCFCNKQFFHTNRKPSILKEMTDMREFDLVLWSLLCKWKDEKSFQLTRHVTRSVSYFKKKTVHHKFVKTKEIDFVGCQLYIKVLAQTCKNIENNSQLSTGTNFFFLMWINRESKYQWSFRF